MQQAWEVTTKETNTMDDDYTKTAPKERHNCLSAVEHAALATGQPCSGTPWLDEMLAKARREKLAGQALAGLLVEYVDHNYSFKEYSRIALDAADALIAELDASK